jgi:hypothetical protein
MFVLIDCYDIVREACSDVLYLVASSDEWQSLSVLRSRARVGTRLLLASQRV